MPKPTATVASRVREFPNSGLVAVAETGNLFCKFCHEKVNYKKLSTIQNHLKSLSHQKKSGVKILVNPKPVLPKPTNDFKIKDLSVDSLYQETKPKPVKFSSSCDATGDPANLDLCLICHRSQNVSQAKQIISEYFNWSRDDGVESDSLSCLDTNLLPVFVLRRVLNFPKTECAKIFRATLGAVNPADWFLLCESCLQLINQTYQLEKQLEGLKVEVRKQLKTSVANTTEQELDASVHSGEGGVLNIREMIRNYFKGENLNTQLPLFPEIVSDDLIGKFEPAFPSSTIKRRGRPKKINIQTSVPRESEPFLSSSIQKRDRGRPRKSESEVPITIKREVILGEESEPQVEPLEFDAAEANQDNDACWSPNPGTPGEPSSEESDEEYTAAKKRKRLSKPSACKPRRSRLQFDCSYRYTCQHCGKPYRHSSSYHRHLRTHKGHKAANEIEIPYEDQLADAISANKRIYRCKDCPELFLTLKQEYEHRSTTHGSMFNCHLCPKRFPTQIGLQGHLIVHRRKPYRCDQCDKTMLSRLVYLAHVKNAHDHPDGKFPCETCGVRMMTEERLKYHQKVHAEKPTPVRVYKPAKTPTKNYFYRFTCDDCGKQYRKLRSYLRHRQAHSDGRIFVQQVPRAGTSAEPDSLEPNNLNLDCKISSAKDNDKFANLVALSKLSSNSPMKCDVCFRCYIKPEDLLEHILTVHKSENLYTCQVCSHSFTSQASLIIHMYVHMAIKHQVCFVCQSNFPRRKHLLEHLTQEHDVSTSATCIYCEEVFPDLYKHKMHLQTAHEEPDNFVCSVCEESYTTASAIMRHLYKHNRYKNRVFHCPDCSETFFSAIKQHEHRIAVHGASSSFKCEICSKEFITPIGLRAHVHAVHRNTSVPYRCDICDKTLSSKSNMQQHMKIVHSDEKPFTCEICGFSTKSNKHLTKHKSTHDKKFVCTHCGRKFSHPKYLEDHMGVHTGEVVVCEECGHQFHAKRYLLRHITLFHTGDNPPPVRAQRFQTVARSNWFDRQEGKRYYATPTATPVPTPTPEQSFLNQEESKPQYYGIQNQF